MAIHISVDTYNLTKQEAEALSGFYNTLASSLPVERPSREMLEPAPNVRTEGTGLEPTEVCNPTVEEVEAELPDLTEDEPTAVDDVDSNGTPWDERIHSGSKTTNKDGSWKKRKGVTKEAFDAVMAELSGAAPQQEEQHHPDAANVGFQSQQQQTTPDVGFQSQQQQQEQLTWPVVLQRTVGAGKSQEELNQVMQALGLEPNFALLSNHPDKFGQFLQMIGA